MASSHQNVLDPQLGATPYGNAATPPRLLPPLSSLTAGPRFDAVQPERSAYPSQTHPSPHPYPRYQRPPLPPQPGIHASLGHQNGHTGAEGNGTPYDVGAAESPGRGADSAVGEDTKRARACEACRGLKVRCDQDPTHPEIPCKRCAKAGRQCIVTQPSRKRQKKADSRVAELEKKLDALTAALQTTQQHGLPKPEVTAIGLSRPAAPVAPQLPATSPSVDAPSSIPALAPSRSNTTSAASGQKRKRPDDEPVNVTSKVDGADLTVPAPLQHDVTRSGVGTPALETDGRLTQGMVTYLTYASRDEFIKRIDSIISPDLAASIFNRYVTDLCPNLPAVVFPPGTTASQVFAEKPILYVSILSTAGLGTLHDDTARAIKREAIGAIADNVVRSGAKSLELIQAMQVLALWYKPPERAEATNFYQIIHMAAVMALDIGLGRRFNPAKARRGFGGPMANYAPGPGKTLPQDSDTLEARRAWLCCYYLCASASMVLRRPNLVRWTNYMKECIEVLESHPDAPASDKLFIQYVKIQHICEDIGLQFLMDDSTANISIKDPKVTYALNVLEGQLKKWKEEIPAECRTNGLRFFEHVGELYLHEIALHFNHNIDDFRLPFTEESLKSVNNTSDVLTPNQVAALEACLKAAHGILDTMASFELQLIKNLPTLIFFVRCIYAIVILIKMHVAVCTPNSELGKIMSPEDLRVDHYLNTLMRLCTHMGGSGPAESPHKPLLILGILRDWFNQHSENMERQRRGEPPVQPSSRPRAQPSQQNPLQLLSQVATDKQQAIPSSTNPSEKSGPENADWSFGHPGPFDWGKKPDMWNNALQTARKISGSNGPSSAPGPKFCPNSNVGCTGSTGVDQCPVDPLNPDFGWGSGFEQAMDLTLGGTDSLQGSGLDEWFLGDNVAPFGFQGDNTTSVAQQW